MSAFQCSHATVVTRNLHNYEIIVGKSLVCKDGMSKVLCHVCKTIDHVHACLECQFFGCFDEGFGLEHGHMEVHAHAINHITTVNMDHGSLFCFMCSDYIYDDRCEDILEKYREKSYQYRAIFKPKAYEVDLLKKAKVIKIRGNSLWGLRGLINIGNTCYANCILQVLLHTRILKNYFLTDKHRCFLQNRCLSCETYFMFQEFYSGKTEPYVPTSFFAAAEIYFKFAIGVDPHDALEFLEKVIEGLHDSLEKSEKSKNCNCFIHDAFYGISQTTYFCEECKYSYCGSEISFVLLYLDTSCDDPEFPNSNKVHLLTCLNNYIKPKLSLSACPKCDERNVKEQTQIRKLPHVLTIVFSDCKYEKDVIFPKVINLPPNLSSKYDTEKTHPSDFSTCYSKHYDYRLYASVEYRKLGGSGHYTTFLQQYQDIWFQCDDAIITKYVFAELNKFKFKVLFYHKEIY
ncbi:ubiquitin carboxyl-terminal hydrolase 22 [Trichonephila clavata]|uniref:ubiquitinyl hydrolase 1 n=1 Tax=Trichonephila clavata TaxID=2740835 RepID=A0A8X6KAW7_TRICU|nr:ubiquitin carboxyl-terminal hydrolase 22 [Trichonephila clavata]